MVEGQIHVGPNGHISPHHLWIQCDACQRSIFVASYLNGTSINYDAFQLNFDHDFNHHQFQRFSLPESCGADLDDCSLDFLHSSPGLELRSLRFHTLLFLGLLLISFFKKVLRWWNCENVHIASSSMTDIGYGRIDIYFSSEYFL